MTSIVKTEGKLRRPSKRRPKSLILSIPPVIREIMEFEHKTEVELEVCLEKDEKIVIIRKK